MKSHARVVVIGGGIVGVSTLYHLTKAGWSDVVLVEKADLTHGSTWHAAGLMPLFNMSYTVGQIHKYSIELYPTLEAETGQPVGFHKTGSLRLANTPDRMDEFRAYCGIANTIGVPFELITPAEVRDLWPLCEIDGLVGAIYHPQDGHCAPADVTQALAAGARSGGAEIYRWTEVTAIQRTPGGEWRVVTDKGDIVADIVVSATGTYARQTGALVGLDVPAIPVEHHYIVTEEVPELVARKRQGLPELAVLREPDASYYMREEREGLILGPYEKGAPAWAVDGVPAGFGQELLPPDLDRLETHVEAAIHRVPAFGRAGIKEVVNGPISYTPDGNPLLGPAWGVPNYFLAEGFSFGINAGGGAGKYLSEWIVEGEPSIDLMPVDPRRYGAYANKAYTRTKNEEAYDHTFVVHYPMEERAACRPARTSPCHDRLDARGAVWGQRYGWERPNWFAADGEERRDHYSFRRGNWFDAVGRESRAASEGAGLIDLTGFTKHQVSGPGAAGFLDRLVANRLPSTPGRIQLCHALTPRGMLRSEFTITRDGPESFYLVSAAAAERYDNDLLVKRAPADGSVRIENVTNRIGVLVLIGPKARDVLAAVTDADVSNAAFPWLTAREILIGTAPVRALRVNFVGLLGWELHHPIEYQTQIFDRLVAAGAAVGGLAMVGLRAMESLRLEKSYRMWGHDLYREVTPLEAGLDRFVRLDKGDFTGRDALVAQQARGLDRRFVTLQVDVDGTDPLGNEPIWQGERMVGRATSGGFGHLLGTGVCLGYVSREAAAPGTELEVELLMDRRPARVVAESPRDPQNQALRA